MYVSGMVGVYVETIHIGGGHYINVGVPILFLSIFVYLIIAKFIFTNIRKGKKR